MKKQTLALNKSLDLTNLKDEFAKSRRIRIKNILETESADTLADLLERKTPWQLAYTNELSQPVLVENSQLSDMTEAEVKEILDGAHQRATNQYQFAYKTFLTINAINSGLINEDSMFYQIATFLNSTEFIGFARELTGVNTLVKLDPQLTLYEPSHFLNLHNDLGDKRDSLETGVRRFAVVLGLTRKWDVNWGGNTTFYDTNTSKEAITWYPDFNTLGVFEVPVLHRVSMVTPFAQAGRYSITGWLREDPQIQRPDLDFY